MHTTVERHLDGHTNMARDAALLDLAEQSGAFARVYSWDGPWVSLGRFQTPDRALRDPDGIPWVMRPTGGKAVLHGHDVTVGLACNLGLLGLSADTARRVSHVYRHIVGPLAAALTESGLTASLAESTRFVRSAGKTADCFAHVSPNDVVDPATGIKVCGCALRLTQRAVLLQASIPVRAPLVDPRIVFEAPHAPGPTRDLCEDA
ncbi:MAG TPA: hypothetical protein VNI20_02570, partial [Fimbriimonadaceae bacterium]|nr:hypothetical protein [Fimbriimonadaceae bacterium]